MANTDLAKPDEIMYEKSIEYLKDKKKITIMELSRVLHTSYSNSGKVFTRLQQDSFIDNEGRVIKKKVCEYLHINCYSFIFLDVDGVLNCRTTKDTIDGYRGIEDNKVKLLKDLVDATGALIILISSWKLSWTSNEAHKCYQDTMANYLDEKLAKYGLQVKEKINEDYTFGRGDAINKFLDIIKASRCVVSSFVILDDELFDYQDAKLMYHLVQTSFQNGGLQEKHVRRAKEKLL